MKAYPTLSIPRSGGCKACAARATLGFTLIELLVSMTILIVLVGLLTVAFNSASTAWLQQERTVEQFQQARATIDLISRDLQQAIVLTNIQFYANIDSLAFVAVNNDDTNAVDLAEVVYRRNWDNPQPFKLWRRYTKSHTSAGAPIADWDFYTNTHNWPVTKTTSNLVCDGVVELKFYCYATDGTQFAYWNSSTAAAWTEPGLNPAISSGNAKMLDKPPAYIDVELTVVDNKTAALLPTLSGSALDNLTNQTKRAFRTYVKVPTR